MGNTRHQLTILAVTDLSLMTDFYRRAFDWTRNVDVPVYVQFVLPDGMMIGLYERHAFASNTGQVPVSTPRGELSGTELYFHADDLDEAVARLADAGARLLSPPTLRDWGDVAAYFADPEGNTLVVSHPAAD